MGFMNKHSGGMAIPKAIFVMSSHHSGSTWVGYVLGSAPEAAFVGEYFRAWSEELRVPCTICAASGLAECQILHGAEATPAHDAFRFAMERTGKPAIVENSKSLEWTRGFLGRSDVSPRFVLVVKDPRSWFASSRRRTAQDVHQAIARWCAENREYRDFLAARPGLGSTVAYDLLAEFPQREFASLFGACGLTYTDEALKYWTREHHGFAANGASDAILRGGKFASQPGHFRTGDDAFYDKRSQSLFRDDRWRSELTAAEDLAIRENREVAELLASLGFRLTKDGMGRIVLPTGRRWWSGLKSRIAAFR